MKVLVTGFEPFGKEKINPALEAVKRMKDKIQGAEIIKLEVPTVFNKSIKVLDKSIKEHTPDIVICVGQAGGRSNLTIERVGINIDDARIPDNDGNQPIDKEVFKDGENAYFSSLPIKAIVNELIKEKIPAEISNTAGTYVCNHLMYGLLYLIDKKYKNIKGGFVHVPFIQEQVLDKKNTPSMFLDEITRGLNVIVKASIKYDKDIKVTGGTTC